MLFNPVLYTGSSSGGGNYEFFEYYDFGPLNPKIVRSDLAYDITIVSDSNAQAILSGAFSAKPSLVSAFFENCKYIGSQVFYGDVSLRDISFPNCEYVDNAAFYNCSVLSSVLNLPKCSFVGYYAFTSAKSIETILLPECIKVSGYAFNSCARLSSIYLPNCSFVGDYAFQQCSYINGVSLPKCEYIGNAAFAVIAATHHQIEPINIPKCKYIGRGAFNWDTYFASLYAEDCIVIEESAFYRCYNLRNIRIPKCQFIGSKAFALCEYISSIELPSCATLCTMAFNSCPSLRTVILGSSFCSIVGSQASMMFALTSNSSVVNYAITSIYVPSYLYSRYYNDSNWSWYRPMLTSY